MDYRVKQWGQAGEKRWPTRIPLRRTSLGDHSIYAWQCAHCGSCWKVYQNPSHEPGCGPHLIDLRKLRKGRRVVHAEYGIGTVASMSRRREKTGLQVGYVTVRFDRRRMTRKLPMRRDVVVTAGSFRDIPPALLAGVGRTGSEA